MAKPKATIVKTAVIAAQKADATNPPCKYFRANEGLKGQMNKERAATTRPMKMPLTKSGIDQKRSSAV